MKKFYCSGCKHLTLFAPTDDTDFDDPIGGACNHPEVLKMMSYRTTFGGTPKRKPWWCRGKVMEKESE